MSTNTNLKYVMMIYNCHDLFLSYRLYKSMTFKSSKPKLKGIYRNIFYVTII